MYKIRSMGGYRAIRDAFVFKRTFFNQMHRGKRRAFMMCASEIYKGQELLRKEFWKSIMRRILSIDVIDKALRIIGIRYE